MARAVRDAKAMMESQRAVAAADPNRQADHLVDVLKGKLLKQKEELENRTDSINAIQRNFEQLSRLYSGEKSEFEKLKGMLKQAMAEIEDLRAQVKLNNVVRAEFERVSSEYASFRQVMYHCMEGFADLHLQHRLGLLGGCDSELFHLLQSSSAKDGVVDGHLQHIEELTASVVRLEASLQETSQQLSESLEKSREFQSRVGKLEEENAALRAQIRAVEVERDRLKEALHQSEGERSRVEASASMQDKSILNLRAEAAELQEELERLRLSQGLTMNQAQLNAMVHEAEAGALRTSLEEGECMLAFMNELRKAEAELSSAAIDAVKLQLGRQVTSLTSQVDSLKAELSTRRMSLGDQDRLLRELRERVATADASVTSLKREKVAAMSERDSLSAQVCQLTEELSRLREQAHLSASASSDSQALVAQLREELAAARAQAQ
eukprot:RCo010912